MPQGFRRVTARRVAELRHHLRRKGGPVPAGLALRPAVGRVVGRVVEALEGRILLAADDPIINEFMASNTHTLAAADGSFPDWIEVYNPGSAAVNLAGWHLTDKASDLAEWTFPSSNASLTTVAAGGYKLIFASGNGTTANQGIISNQLHTNFSLSASGEYLGLTRPDNAVVSDFAPTFPAQNADVSYGPGPSSAVTTPLVSTPAPVRVRVPTDGSLGTAWTGVDFDDSGWTSGTTGVGFEQGVGGGPPALPNEIEPNDTTGTPNDASTNFVSGTGLGLYQMGLKGTISSSTDVDFFNVGAMQAGDVLTATASGSASSRGTLTDPTLQLWRNNGGSPIQVTAATSTGNDNNGPGTTGDELINRFSIATADTYYVRVGRNGGASSATYDIGLWLANTGAAPGTGGTVTAESANSNNTAATADAVPTSWRQVQYKSTTTASMGSSTDSDYYKFTFTAGDLVALNVDSTSSADARVTLYSAIGATSVVALEDGTSARPSPDDSKDSSVYSYIVPTTGIYYARVQLTSGTTTTGSYNLEAYLSTNTPPQPPGNPAAYTGLINTNVAAPMAGVNASAYVRVPFTVGEDVSATTLTLSVKYDDGYVAYLNGTEVARKNAGGTAGTPLAFNAPAASDRANNLGQVFENVDLTAFKGLLVNGTNVLAIQGLNSGAANNDFLIAPELKFTTTATPGLQYMSAATPGAANVAGVSGQVKDTKFSDNRGFYSAPIDVAITTATAGAEIRYTTDGSVPTATTGTVYTAPIHVAATTVLRAAAFKPGLLPTNVDTQTYLFAASTLTQTRPSTYPVNWLGDNGSGTTPGDYDIDPEVVNDPAYHNTFLLGLAQVPTLSIVTDQNNLFDQRNASGTSIASVPNQGIYDHPQSENSASLPLNAWEKPASFELINPDGSNGFHIDGGLRMQGAASRAPTGSSKHSFRVAFRSDYGDGTLDYPLFKGSPVTELAGFILRGTYNNSWTHRDGTQRGHADYVKDGFARVTQAAMGDLAVRQKYVNVYLNGVYWGLYDATDRADADFAASMLGGDKSQYDAVNAGTAIDGDNAAWNQVLSIANGGTIGTQAGLQAIGQYLDLTDFADYIIYNTWAGNNDWDSGHNWYGVRQRTPGAGYKILNWDAERTLEGLGDNALGTNNANGPSHVFQQLRTNPEFRLLFADRVHRALFNAGALTPAATTARYDALANQINQTVVAESARWGDNRRDTNLSGVTGTQKLWTQADWLAEKARVETYFQGRTNQMVNGTSSQYQAASLYPTVAAPEYNQFGGSVAGGFQVTMTNPSGGTVYYTTDGTDPRAAFTGAVAPSAQVYNPSSPPALAASSQVQARILSNGTWSALTDASFIVGPPPALRVSEVMYHPAAPAASTGYSAQDMEFVEFQNTGGVPLDTSGYQLGYAVNYTFPDGSPVLQPGGRIVVAANPTAFQSRYGSNPGGATVLGGWVGDLTDAGDRLTLTSPFGQAIQDFTYSGSWYADTNGDGFSLVARDPASTDPNVLSTAAGWRPSASLNGGPGVADPGINPGGVVVNEVLANPAAGSPAGDWIELTNTTTGSIDVSNWYLSDSSANLAKYRIPAGTVIPAGGFATFTQTSDFGGAFTLADAGGTVYLTQGDAGGALGGYRDDANFGATDPGFTYGRFLKPSQTGWDFTPLASATFGAANATALIGPVVINELMYNPAGGVSEYIELRNRTTAAVPLYDPANPPNAWRFTNGIDFAFPAGATIPANGYALVVAVDPTTFRAQYPNVPAAVPVYGPYTSAGANVLDNGGERVTLSRPGVPAGATVPYIEVDSVNYSDGGALPFDPWPTAPDGAGASLARLNSGAYGNDAANWAGEPTGGSPGKLNFDTGVPAVQSVAVNDGVAQRSKVNGLTVTFDHAVALGAGAFSLVGRNGAGAGTTVSWSNPTGDGQTWVLSFGGSPVVGGSLADGIYDLTVVASQVHSAAGPAMAADYAFKFHRLFSDADGDGDSDNFDLLQLRPTLLKPSTDPAYKWYFDYNQSNVVDNLDVFQIRSRRGVVFQGY